MRRVSNDARITSPGVAKRLKQPLIGLSILGLEASSSQDLLAIQLTKVGDLFYQLLAKDKSERLQHCKGDVAASKNNCSYIDVSDSTSLKSKSVCNGFSLVVFLTYYLQTQ